MSDGSSDFERETSDEERRTRVERILTVFRHGGRGPNERELFLVAPQRVAGAGSPGRESRSERCRGSGIRLRMASAHQEEPGCRRVPDPLEPRASEAAPDREFWEIQSDGGRARL